MPYRPPQTVKPLIDGPQIAIVVGPPGEEIFTDQYGRVKVHFPWDRHKDPKDEDSSCWIRVSQIWGGGKYGGMALPRIGHEVIVDFLEGDPDQPIIIGRTYHEMNQPPYALPDNKTKMVIRSDTHKNDKGKIGFNELSFEDDKGREKVFIHAERDKEIHVKNNSAERVDKNSTLSIGNFRYQEVGGNNYDFIGGSYLLNIGSIETAIKARIPSDSLDENIMNAAKYIVDSSEVGKDGNYILSVARDASTTVSGNLSTITGEGIMLSSGGYYTLNVLGKKSEIIESDSFEKVNASKTIKANEKINFLCGNSMIVMHKNGKIEIKGIEIILTASKIKLN